MSKVEYDQELLDSLDPDKDYGESTVEEVRHNVVSGNFSLAPGLNGRPIITNVRTGRRVKGTAAPPKREGESDRAWFQRRFNERFAEDFDAVYDAQYENATGKKRDSRDIDNMMTRGGGRPSQQTSGASDAVAGLFKLLAEAAMSSKLTIIDVESEQIEGPDAS